MLCYNVDDSNTCYDKVSEQRKYVYTPLNGIISFYNGYIIINYNSIVQELPKYSKTA